ncbi:Cof-type HAD-IIB family hydrolase [Brevibacillus choshinensis]|uniref:Cof-type HAD-IIB family hydrolase n=1 Tax=Brevibacillus choshinensis TaxID=54911 RepID=UPI002E1F3B05|nr:Cof-type HAD-IIB family hydrolase [Brevibacillus choshinensis]MED4751639.1 Cof-type HAD-IIB family hydrolase [Brevibacillus choshinensis]
MSYKLLALDVDGTLLKSNHTLSKLTQQVIAGLVERGIHVTLATGRAYPSAKSLAQLFHMQVPLITHDGAFVADPRTDRVLYAKRIPHEVAAQITEVLVAHRLDIMLLHESYAVTNRSWRWKDIFPLLNAWTIRQLWREQYPMKIQASSSLAEYVRVNKVAPPKFYVTGEPERLTAAQSALLKSPLKGFRVTASGANNLEILPEGVSKASGLEIVSAELKIATEQIVAVGDNFNDAEMIRFAGMGVAMGNAPDDIKQMAQYVTDTNDQDGVVSVARKFFDA